MNREYIKIDNEQVSLYYNDKLDWSILINDIKVVAFCGDDSVGEYLDRIIFVDKFHESKYINLGSLKNFTEFTEWLKSNYNFNTINWYVFEESTRVFYPKKYYGVPLYENSISNWFKEIFNPSKKRLNQPIKKYIDNK